MELTCLSGHKRGASIELKETEDFSFCSGELENGGSVSGLKSVKKMST